MSECYWPPAQQAEMRRRRTGEILEGEIVNLAGQINAANYRLIKLPDQFDELDVHFAVELMFQHEKIGRKESPTTCLSETGFLHQIPCTVCRPHRTFASLLPLV